MNEQNEVKKFFASTLGRVTVTIVSAIIIWGIMLLSANTDSMVIALIILAVCTYFGWRALNKITPNLFLFMSIGAWLIYFIVKGVLSFLLGFIIAPFQIGKMISDAVANSMREDL